jgi:hypothetical protein
MADKGPASTLNPKLRTGTIHSPMRATGSPYRHRRSGLLGLALALLIATGACLPPPRPPATPTPPPTEVPTSTPTPAAFPSPAPSPAASPSPTVTASPTTTPVAAPSPTGTPAPAAVNKRGVHLLLDDGSVRFPDEVWNEHVAGAARLVGRGGYVVEVIRSDDLRPDSWQHFADLVDAEGLTPIIRLATFKDPRNDWWTAPTPDPGGQSYRVEAERFRRFFDAIDWHAETILVTVANEPNRPDEWGGAPDPAAYARFLRDVTDAMRRVSSVRVLVLNGALDAYAPSQSFGATFAIDAERFMEGMVAEIPDVFERLDGWASHAYPLGPFGEHPGRQQFKIDDVRPEARPRRQPPAGVVNRGVNGYSWELWKLQQLGLTRDLPVYVTETGWRHVRSQAPRSRDADFAIVEDDRFADLVGLAFDGPRAGPADGWTPWNHDDRVKTAALFAFGGRPDIWGHTNLVLVDPAGHILGTYPFAEALARVSPGVVAREPVPTSVPPR